MDRQQILCVYPTAWTLHVNKMFEEAPSLPIQNAAPAEAEAEVKSRRRKATEKAPQGIIVGVVRNTGLPAGVKRHYNGTTLIAHNHLKEINERLKRELDELDVKEHFDKSQQWDDSLSTSQTIRKEEDAK